MRIKDVFSRTELMQTLSILKWMEANNYTAEMIEQELFVEVKSVIEREKEARQESLKKVYANPVLKANVPLCKKCGDFYKIEESELPEWETQLVCAECGHTEYLDISPVDFGMEVEAKIRGKEVEFKPEEIKATKGERNRRRKICFSCEHLNGTTCKACGCSAKHRTYYDILKCPTNKW